MFDVVYCDLRQPCLEKGSWCGYVPCKPAPAMQAGAGAGACTLHNPELAHSKVEPKPTTLQVGTGTGTNCKPDPEPAQIASRGRQPVLTIGMPLANSYSTLVRLFANSTSSMKADKKLTLCKLTPYSTCTCVHVHVHVHVSCACA